MHCPNCGANELLSRFKWCPECGVQLPPHLKVPRTEEGVCVAENETNQSIDNRQIQVITSNVQLSGQLETHTIDQAKAIFDVNTFSVINLIKAILPLMKKQRDGRVIVVSNQAGIEGIPFHGIYCASRFAVEGFMECIAPECLAFNIHCSVIETSMIKGEEKTAQTIQVSICSRMENADDDTKKYQDSCSGKMRRQRSVKKLDLKRVAQLIEEIITDEKPHFRYQLNKSAKEAAKDKWTDVHGDSNIFDAAEKYLLVETERLREVLDNLNSSDI